MGSRARFVAESAAAWISRVDVGPSYGVLDQSGLVADYIAEWCQCTHPVERFVLAKEPIPPSIEDAIPAEMIHSSTCSDAGEVIVFERKPTGLAQPHISGPLQVPSDWSREREGKIGYCPAPQKTTNEPVLSERLQVGNWHTSKVAESGLRLSPWISIHTREQNATHGMPAETRVQTCSMENFNC